MAKMKNYSSRDESIKSVWNNSGDKRYGFVSRDRIPDQRIDSRWQTRYGAGVDNLPISSGYSEREISTPLGNIDYGHDGDTGFVGFTPNISRTSDYYTNGEGNPWHMDYTTLGANGDRGLNYGTYGNPSDPTYFATAFLGGNKNYIPDFDKTINTPLGSLELSRNTEEPNSLSADVRPNEYIMALARLLAGQR